MNNSYVKWSHPYHYGDIFPLHMLQSDASHTYFIALQMTNL